MGRRYSSRLPICCAFFVCFVGSAFGIPLMGEIPLEEQRKLTGRPVQNLQILGQLDREKELYVTLELSSTAIRRACQDAEYGLRRRTQRDTGRHARIQCHGFFDVFPAEVAGFELPPETPWEHNYRRRKGSLFAGNQKSDADIRSTSASESPTLRHSPQPLNSQAENFFPDTQADLDRKDISPLLDANGRHSDMSPTRTLFNPDSFYSTSDSIERPARQIKFGAFHPDYETLRDTRQLKFLTSYPDPETVRESRQIKFGAFYPNYEIVGQRYPRQMKFESLHSDKEVLD